MYATTSSAKMPARVPEKKIVINKKSLGQARRKPVALESPMLAHLFDAMRDLHTWMNDQHVPYVLGGDAARTLLWQPRVTCELDVLIDLPVSGLKRLIDSAAQHGFYHAPDIEGESRNGAQLNFEHGPSTVSVSLWVPETPVQRVAAREPMRVDLEDFVVNLPSPENFLLLSAGWERGPDWEEVASMLRHFPSLDREYLFSQARKFDHEPGMRKLESALSTIPSASRRNGTEG